MLKKILSNIVYNTPAHFMELEIDYSKHLERTSKYDSDIRHFQYEFRMCDKAVIAGNKFRCRWRRL